MVRPCRACGASVEAEATSRHLEAASLRVLARAELPLRTVLILTAKAVSLPVCSAGDGSDWGGGHGSSNSSGAGSGG